MEHCAQHSRRGPQPRRQKTERCALLRGRGRNRTAERERDLNELLYTSGVALPVRANMQRIARSAAVWLFRLSRAGNSRRLIWTVTRRGVEPRSEEKHRKNSLPFVPCPRALSQRGAGNQFIIYSMKKNRGEWGVEPRSTQESRNRCSPYCTASHDGCRKHYYQSSMR